MKYNQSEINEQAVNYAARKFMELGLVSDQLRTAARDGFVAGAEFLFGTQPKESQRRTLVS